MNASKPTRAAAIALVVAGSAAALDWDRPIAPHRIELGLEHQTRHVVGSYEGYPTLYGDPTITTDAVGLKWGLWETDGGSRAELSVGWGWQDRNAQAMEASGFDMPEIEFKLGMGPWAQLLLDAVLPFGSDDVRVNRGDVSDIPAFRLGTLFGMPGERFRWNGGAVVFFFANDNDVHGYGSDGLLRDRVFYLKDSTCGEGWSGCDIGLGVRAHLAAEFDPFRWGGADLGADYVHGLAGTDGSSHDVFKHQSLWILDPGVHLRLPLRMGLHVDAPFTLTGEYAATSWAYRARITKSFGL